MGLFRPLEAARRVISAMRVFHIWIGDLDRDTHQISVDLDAGEGTLPLAFFDYSFSMSFHWNCDDCDTPTQPTYCHFPTCRR
jgi:hypothetical protein